jgi:hypothetical protein
VLDVVNEHLAEMRKLADNANAGNITETTSVITRDALIVEALLKAYASI